MVPHSPRLLCWLGLLDVVESIAETRATDTKINALKVLAVQWYVVIRSEPITVKELVAKAMKHAPDAYGEERPCYPEFWDALMAVGAAKGGGVDNGRVGRWLRNHAGEIIEEIRIVQAGEYHHVQRWRCEPISGPIGEAPTA
jgi:hypothetical protein